MASEIKKDLVFVFSVSSSHKHRLSPSFSTRVSAFQVTAQILEDGDQLFLISERKTEQEISPDVHDGRGSEGRGGGTLMGGKGLCRTQSCEGFLIG